jgi:hypothetical protein
VSNAFSSIPGGDVNSTSGVLFSRGIVTQFTFVGGATPTSTPTPTPTPATPAPTPTPTVPASTPTPTATTTPAATPTPTPTPTPHAVPGVSGPGLGVLAGALLLGTLLFVWRARRRAGAV